MYVVEFAEEAWTLQYFDVLYRNAIWASIFREVNLDKGF